MISIAFYCTLSFTFISTFQNSMSFPHDQKRRILHEANFYKLKSISGDLSPKNRVNVFQPKRTRSCWLHTPVGMRQRNEASTSFAISHTNSCPWRITPRFPKERPGGRFLFNDMMTTKVLWTIPVWVEGNTSSYLTSCVVFLGVKWKIKRMVIGHQTVLKNMLL